VLSGALSENRPILYRQNDVQETLLSLFPIYRRLPKLDVKDVDARHPYLAERGIRLETAEQFGIGYFAGKGGMSGRIVIPFATNSASRSLCRPLLHRRSALVRWRRSGHSRH
jgi:hypothetical protein